MTNDTTLTQQEALAEAMKVVKQYTEAYLWIERQLIERGLEIRSGFFGFVVVETETNELVNLARDLRGLIEFLVTHKAVSND